MLWDNAAVGEFVSGLKAKEVGQEILVPENMFS